MTKILIIDDETLLREEVMEWLTMTGYEVIGAADGLEGVNLALTHLPDVILCAGSSKHTNTIDPIYIYDCPRRTGRYSQRDESGRR
jgi:CheY-like chemotaxis protein